jgi:hypothetical protein
VKDTTIPIFSKYDLHFVLISDLGGLKLNRCEIRDPSGFFEMTMVEFLFACIN